MILQLGLFETQFQPSSASKSRRSLLGLVDLNGKSPRSRCSRRSLLVDLLWALHRHFQRASVNAKMTAFWIFFAISSAILWVFSFRKVLTCSSSSSVPANALFLSNSTGSGNGGRKRNVLLVVAHPDDESMFFAPTILYLISKGHSLHILCISTGDAEGKGNVRCEELYRACAILKVPLQQIKIVDHLDLQDGFDKPWKNHLLAAFAEEEFEKHSIDVLITFDNYGVSGHPNHRDLHNGICMLLRENPGRNIEAWELISTSIIRKYIGPLDIWFSIFPTPTSRGGSIYCLTNGHPMKSYQAMAEHSSQWVWYRKLFVLLSRYTYVNTLQRISC